MVYSSDVPYGFRLFLWAVIIKDLTKAAQNDSFIVLQDPHVGFSYVVQLIVQHFQRPSDHS